MVEQVKTKSEPRVRFCGFTDEWEEVKLGDVVDSVPTKKHIVDGSDGDEYPIYKQGDNVFDGYGYGDAFNDYANVVLFGDHTLSLHKPQSPFLLSTDGVKILKANGINPKFMYTLIGTYMPDSQGYKRHFTILRETTVFKPASLEEQQKIGELFQALDNVIDLSNTQAENLKQQKKALLQRMFPQKGETEPNVRLRGFTDAWEEVKFGDVLNYSQPTKYIVESDNYDDSFTTPVLTAGKSFLLGYTNEIDGIYDKGDVILFDDFTTATQLVDFEFKVKSSAMKLLTPIGDNNINFLYETLNLIRYPHDDHKRYWISEYATLKVKVPCDNDEQQAIGELFQTLDEQIRLAEDKVKQYKELKQALLQRLFV